MTTHACYCPGRDGSAAGLFGASRRTPLRRPLGWRSPTSSRVLRSTVSSAGVSIDGSEPGFLVVVGILLGVALAIYMTFGRSGGLSPRQTSRAKAGERMSFHVTLSEGAAVEESGFHAPGPGSFELPPVFHVGDFGVTKPMLLLILSAVLIWASRSLPRASASWSRAAFSLPGRPSTASCATRWLATTSAASTS